MLEPEVLKLVWFDRLTTGFQILKPCPIAPIFSIEAAIALKAEAKISPENSEAVMVRSKKSKSLSVKPITRSQ